MRVVVEADGGSRGNPGPSGYGAAVFDAASGEVLAERMEAIGTATNNVAEYRGLIAGLEAAIELGATSVHVRMDSKLVIEQMGGNWNVKHPSLRPLASEASALLGQFSDVSLEWIPREKNKHADRLANEAMDAAAGVSRRPTAAAARASAVPVEDASEAPTSWVLPEGQPTTLIMIRHGATMHTPHRIFSGRNDQPLSASGHDEVQALAGSLALRYDGVSAVVSSPLLRARETADIVAARLGCPVEEIDAFAEIDFGVWEGLNGEEVRAQWPQDYAAWLGDPSVPAPNGESLTALTKRARRARDQVIAAHPGERVVVASHVTPIKALLCLALGAPTSSIFRMFLDSASMSVVDYFPNGASVVRLVNGR